MQKQDKCNELYNNANGNMRIDIELKKLAIIEYSNKLVKKNTNKYIDFFASDNMNKNILNFNERIYM